MWTLDDWKTEGKKRFTHVKPVNISLLQPKTKSKKKKKKKIAIFGTFCQDTDKAQKMSQV